MNKKISTQALLALKDALTNIYWKKEDLRQFVEFSIENKAIVSTIDWLTNAKSLSVSQLVDRMVTRQDMYQDDLLHLLRETSNMSDFSHLEFWDKDGTKNLIPRAKQAVEKLRAQTKGYFDALQELKKTSEKRADTIQKVNQTVSFAEKLDSLKREFIELATSSDAQQRGYKLEKLLNELFKLFNLFPKEAYKVRGEQIDGSFTFDSTDYLLEAKWQKYQVNASDLYIFGSKISGKLKNTLGLFVSIDGFSKDSTETGSPVLKSMILMDGMDLMMILDGRIRLDEMILKKRRHASDTGEIFFRIVGV